MPLYEYLCGSCGHRFERIRKFSDAPLTECPSCAGGPVEKQISSPAIQFKGSGWYITDYAKSGAPKDGARAATSDKPTGDKPAGATTSSSDSTSSGSTAPAPTAATPAKTDTK